LLYVADEIYQKNTAPPCFETLVAPSLVKKFRVNKVSLAALQLSINRLGVQLDLPLQEIIADEESTKQWGESLSFASNLFSLHDAECVFIKALNPSWAIMSDLDILPASGLDELKALEALKEEGYELYQFRLLRHPLKIMASKGNDKISLDFYPQPMWIRKKVCDSKIVTSRKIVTSFNGVNAFVASPEDDIYLIGTHGCGHLKFTLAEIIHGINVFKNSKNFDWTYLINLSIEVLGILEKFVA